MSSGPAARPDRANRASCMLHVILFQPEIPPNTGNIIRLCANAGAVLHLIEPLGFHIDDARLRRAGLDYHELACIRRHRSWGDFRRERPVERLIAFSTRGGRRYDRCSFRAGDGLLFGPETRGLPDGVLDQLEPECRLRLPMAPGQRSLNLSNSVAIALYEAWRQLGFRDPTAP